MTSNAAGDVAVADAIGKNNAGDIVAAGENGGQVSTAVGAGGNSDDVGFEAGEFNRTMGLFVAGPKLHTAEGASGRRGAFECLRFDLFEFHEGLMLTHGAARHRDAVTT